MPHIHTKPGEIDRTAAVYIVHVPSRRVLLRLHDKHHIYLPPGGHIENHQTAPEAAIAEAEEAIKSGDKDSIEARSQALATAAQKLGEQMYAKAQAEAGGAPEGGAGDSGKAADADVVDAEFTEVKDKK